MKLPLSFYQREDTLLISRELLGKYLFTCINGELCGGIITETEAYMGPADRGSHAWNNRRTARTEIMFGEGGFVYMYICYGIHDMLNIVAGKKEKPHAILIRALEPFIGIDIMRQRRGIFNEDIRLCRGPGALAKAMGLNKSHNGISLEGGEIWIEDRGMILNDEQICTSPRVGMNFAGFYKTVPWRFYIKGSRYVSKG